MKRFGCLLLTLALCDGVFSEDDQKGFVQPLDFGPIFNYEQSGVSSLAAKRLSAAMLKADQSQYPHLFDTIVSSSIDSLQARVAPKDTFSPERFGFNPIASQGFNPPVKSARLVSQPKPKPQHPLYPQFTPLRYEIKTVHDPNYKVYTTDENAQTEDILANLKKDPSVAAYFKPAVTNIEVSHPIKYRTEEFNENTEEEKQYKPNHYITGTPRLRRYAGGDRRNANLRKKSSEEDEESDDYRDDYSYRPKSFDGGQYKEEYKEEKDPNKDYEYPYAYDSGYDHKEYDRIKELSEKQAAEIKQNPGNCKEVKRDGMTCSICKDPKTGGNYESCSYVAEPKNNKYAYSKQKKFNSNDEPTETENEQNEETPKKIAKYEEAPQDEDSSSQEHDKTPAEDRRSNYNKNEKEDDEDDSDGKYKSYYVHSSKPNPSEALRATEADDSSSDNSDSLVKPYNYKAAAPEFYTDNEPKKDVEHVLAEFKKKDRSTCKKVHKNGMTCFQCVDKSGLKHEECMFVSESAPKRSHLAYQESKEFTSKPPTINAGNEEAESQIVTTNAPPAQRSASYVVANSNYGKKLKRKKAARAGLVVEPNTPAFAIVPAPNPHKVKREVDSEAESRSEITDETNIAQPEEFSGASSKGAFWAETMPRYSATLGVTLPEFMLAKSEHEASFDEAVAGA